ncbi:MAG: hypothetical protein Q8K91_09685 [Hylemonella sp.]|nr:hypothetical protein [Hylemonella sp.]MDP1937460.1 hypothetical protein [Hylemonella sp.]
MAELSHWQRFAWVKTRRSRQTRATVQRRLVWDREKGQGVREAAALGGTAEHRTQALCRHVLVIGKSFGDIGEMHVLTEGKTLLFLNQRGLLFPSPGRIVKASAGYKPDVVDELGPADNCSIPRATGGYS